MPKRYRLDTKIEALNLLDQLDGNLQLVNSRLNIPVKTLQKWSAAQDNLRLQFTDQQDRRFDQLLASLHLKLLERGHAILDHLDDDTLKAATATQLAYALNTIATHAIRLEEIAYQVDQTAAIQNQNQPIRLAFVANSQNQPPPQRPTGNPEPSRPLQNRRLRPPLGQNRTG